MNTQNTTANLLNESVEEGAKRDSMFWGGCCGPDMFDGKEMSNCPCASMFRGSRRSFVVPLTVAALLFLLVVTGWVLGVLAFVRTF